jgi:hypothetical protein
MGIKNRGASLVHIVQWMDGNMQLGIDLSAGGLTGRTQHRVPSLLGWCFRS